MLDFLFGFFCDMAEATALTPEGGIWEVLATIFEWLLS